MSWCTLIYLKGFASCRWPPSPLYPFWIQSIQFLEKDFPRVYGTDAQGIGSYAQGIVAYAQGIWAYPQTLLGRSLALGPRAEYLFSRSSTAAESTDHPTQGIGAYVGADA